MKSDTVTFRLDGATLARDYLVTVRRGQRSRKLFWPAHDPLLLDELARWELRRRNGDILAQQLDNDGEPRRGTYPVVIPLHALMNAAPVGLGDGRGPGGGPELVVTVTPLVAITPAYERGADSLPPAPGELAEHFLFCGLKEHLFSYTRVGSTFKVHVEGRLLFSYSRGYASLGSDGHFLSVHLPGLTLELRNGMLRELDEGREHPLTHEEWTTGRLRYGESWWRVVPVPITDDILIDRTRRGQGTDENRLWRTGRTASVILSVLLIAFAVYPRREPKRRAIATTEVRLREPKRILTGPETGFEPGTAPSMSVAPRPGFGKAPAGEVPQLTEESPVRPVPRNDAGERLAVPPDGEVVIERDGPPVDADGNVREDLVPPRRRDRDTGGDPTPSRPRRGSRRTSSTDVAVSGRGEIPKDELERTMQRHLGFFQDCYERALGKDPRAQGVVMLEWTITKSGTVTDVGFPQSDIADPEMEHCLDEELRRTTFSRPRGGTVRVSFPLVFTSGGR